MKRANTKILNKIEKKRANTKILNKIENIGTNTNKRELSTQ